jgi:hypothetical protein
MVRFAPTAVIRYREKSKGYSIHKCMPLGHGSIRREHAADAANAKHSVV